MLLKVKSNGAIRFFIYMYHFLLVLNNNNIHISNILVISLEQNFVTPSPTPALTQRYFFSKIEWFHPCVRGKAFTQNEVKWPKTYGIFENISEYHCWAGLVKLC